MLKSDWKFWRNMRSSLVKYGNTLTKMTDFILQEGERLTFILKWSLAFLKP